MNYLFFWYTDEWEKIGEAIKRTLQNINIDVKKFNNNNVNDINSEETTIIIVPLFEWMEDDSSPTPKGLETIKELRINGFYNVKPFFIVDVDNRIPDYFNPEKDMNMEAKDIIKNPFFGDVYKAIFLAEIRYDKQDKKYKNMVSIFDNGLNEINKLLDEYANTESSTNQSKFLENYYKTFIRFYDPFGNININEASFNKNLTEFLENESSFSRLLSQNKELIIVLNESTLKATNILYNKLNGIKTQKHGHSVELELFRAPIPFHLQEIYDMINHIKSAIKDNTGTPKIKLLLIDNKTDKIIGDNNLCELFRRYGLNDLFSIDIISNSSEKIIENICNINESNLDDAKFDFKKFETDLDYKKYVYEKIKNSHFILLDFFLNEENTYLAFDFIKDVNDLKKEHNDFSTTWYFITSAVYDSVVKYSQSGLLAEHYETAVVNSGDDPTNEKREIIFVYKLLTFVNARLKNFQNLEIMLNKWFESNNCPNHFNNELCNQFQDCQNFIEYITRKIFIEGNEIQKIFLNYRETTKKLQKISTILTDIFYNFNNLVESDWKPIFHRIDLLNNVLIEKKLKFNCKYIINEVKNRADRY